MKKHNRVVILLIIVNVLCISYIAFNAVKTHILIKDTNDIFEMNMENIIEIKASSEIGESFGTGVIYDKSGLIITNAHVLSYTSLGERKNFESIEVRFINKDNYEKVSLIKIDYDLDLATLQFEDKSKNYSNIKFEHDDYTYGDKVYAIGNTSNYGIGISEGTISVPKVNITYDNINRLVIQANVDISSGNSGGALVNDEGKLIGITTFRTKDLSGNVNYGFAYSIPIETVKKFISEGM